jgi:protein-S-isoprenylcysteine O-methyltransferase Ste14
MQTRNVVRAAVGLVLSLLLVPALLFISAGTLNWAIAWVYVALLLLASIGSRLIVFKRNPDTLRERARFTTAEGTESWDRSLVLISGLLGPIAIAIIAGLGQRFEWSTIVPKAGQYLAAAVIAGGYGLGAWAMVVNRFFSAVARIQQDRGQVVVKEGPYRIMRHPGYAGSLLATLALPIMLDAPWAFIPAVGSAVALIIRTSLEDRLLREELPGYETYVKETRYRLIPGLW